MPQRTISRAELAKLAGVSKAAVTKQCAKGLAPAAVGDRVDLDHAACRAWLAARGVKIPKADRAPTRPKKPASVPPPAPTKPADNRKSRSSKPTAPGPDDELPELEFGVGSPEDLEAIAETIRPLLERFGTERAFRDWLLALKEIETIREKRLSNEEAEGLLIYRELVRTHVYGRIEACHRRLLGDVPKTLTRRVYALAKNGTPIEEAEAVVRELVGSQLDPMKVAVDRTLNARGTD
jgi:hypothetical protein